MTAEPIRPALVNPGHDPARIRAVLPAADRADFEELYAGALDDAKRSFSLEPVNELLEQWRRIAVVSQSPGHAEALEHARMVLAGEDVPVIPVTSGDLDALRRGDIPASWATA